MDERKKPLIRGSVRTDTLNQASFFNSFIMGQAVKKRSKKARIKVELTLEQIDLNEIYGQASGYIEKTAENTIATPFSITCLNFSPEDDIFFFGSSNGNISQYDIKEAKIVDDIPLNLGVIRNLILDRQNDLALIVGETSVMRSYKLPRFELEHEFEGHTLTINRCEMDHKRSLMFTVSDDCTVRMWDLKDNSDKGVILTHSGMGKSLALTPCGRYVFSGGEDFLIRVYDMLLDEEVLNLKSHSGCVWSLSANDSSTLLASGGADYLIIVWNILDFTPLHVFAEHTGTITCLKFTEEGGFLVSGSEDNSMKVWDLENDRREITLNAHTGPIRDILVNSSLEYIVSCSDDKCLKIWAFPEFLEEINFKILNNDFNSVIEANGSIVSCGSDHQVRYWNRETDEAGIIYSTKGVGLKCCASHQGYLAVGDDYGNLYLFSKDYVHMKEFQAHKGPLRDMCFISTGELVTGGGDSKILIWNVETWESRQLRGHQQSIWCLGYCHEPNTLALLASGSSDKTIRLWDLTNSYELSVFQYPEQTTAICLTNDGKYIITGGITGTIIVWSIAENAEESIFQVHTDMVTGIHIGQNNETILTVSKDRSLHFISLQYRIPLSFITRKQPILCLALSEDRSNIITGEHQMMYIQDNPLVTQKIRILGPEDNLQKFLTYMKRLINGQLVAHDITMDKFIIVPFWFNTLHFYTYMGLREHLIDSLVDTASIIPSKNGYHPLYIALLKGFKGIRDDVIDAIINIGESNPFLFQILENVIIKMNKKAFPKLGSIYEAIYRPAYRKSLPKFCLSDINLPIVCIVDYPRAVPETFFDPGDTSTHGQGILFKESYVKINYIMGSQGSIEFLESLAECSNLDVMRSPLIQAMVNYKWENAKYPMMIQGICFYVYLVLLSFYTAFALGNPYFTTCLLLINTLLLLYEVFQMTVSGSFYFTYVWNYIDWVRSITLYIYIIINWFDKDNNISSSMFTITIFFSFVRGISYFRLFKLTRYLINLLFQVVQDIKGFLVLLMYSTLAFCFLFIVLSKGKGGENGTEPFDIYLMQSYNLVLGNFDSTDYHIIEYICLTFALMINPIIMLNLLISIIGDTYDRVQSDNLSADMSELMDMIQEVENMLFFRRGQNKKQFFQECSEFEKQDLDAGWEGKLRAILNIIDSIKEKNAETHEVIMKNMKTQYRSIELQSEKIELIAKKFKGVKLISKKEDEVKSKKLQRLK